MDRNLGGVFIVAEAKLAVPLMVCANRDAAYAMRDMIVAMSDRKIKVIEVPMVYSYGEYVFNDE